MFYLWYGNLFFCLSTLYPSVRLMSKGESRLYNCHINYPLLIRVFPLTLVSLLNSSIYRMWSSFFVLTPSVYLLDIVSSSTSTRLSFLNVFSYQTLTFILPLIVHQDKESDVYFCVYILCMFCGSLPSSSFACLTQPPYQSFALTKVSILLMNDLGFISRCCLQWPVL